MKLTSDSQSVLRPNVCRHGNKQRAARVISTALQSAELSRRPARARIDVIIGLNCQHCSTIAWLQQQWDYSDDNTNRNVPSSFCFTLAFDAVDIGPKADRARLLLVRCCVKNSSSLWIILMSSGVVDREIMRCSRSHVRSPCTNTSTDLQWVTNVQNVNAPDSIC